MTQTQQEISVEFASLMEKLLSLLTERERDVIERRSALSSDRKETLDRIGLSYSITRERVRQIESVALKKLARISMDPSMQKIHSLAVETLLKSGRIQSEDLLISQMLKGVKESKERDVNFMRLAMKVSSQLIAQEKNQFYRAFWRTSDIELSEVKNCISAVKKYLRSAKEVRQEETIMEALSKDFEPEMVRSVFRIDWEFKETEDGWGLSSWRHINPKSIKDKVMIVFQTHGIPMHFNEVINHVINDFSAKKMVTNQAIHNELIRHEEFVLVNRGIYALKEWGLPAGTVCDLIIEVLEKAGEPMRRQDIIAKVLEKREIRIGTISLNLQKCHFFRRVGRAVYTYDASLDKSQRRKNDRENASA